MKLHIIKDLSNQWVVELLRHEFSKIDYSPVLKNYHPDHSGDPANIFYILGDPGGRYQRGNYYVLEDGGRYICSAGWNEYELDINIALGLTRAYVTPEARATYPMGKFILPEIIGATRNYKHLYITANKHNSAIAGWFTRAKNGRAPSIANQWPDIYRAFKPVGIKNIYHTEQYVMEYLP